MPMSKSRGREMLVHHTMFLCNNNNNHQHYVHPSSSSCCIITRWLYFVGPSYAHKKGIRLFA